MPIATPAIVTRPQACPNLPNTRRIRPRSRLPVAKQDHHAVLSLVIFSLLLVQNFAVNCRTHQLLAFGL